MDALLTILIPLLIQVESNGQNDAVGDNGKAVGCLQMWEIAVDDVNRISGKSYTYDDRKDRKKSIEMCKIYLKHYATEKRLGRKPTIEDMAAIWCSGPNGYKKKHLKGVKRYLEKIEKAKIELSRNT